MHRADVLLVTRSPTLGETASRAIGAEEVKVTVLEDVRLLERLLLERSWDLVFLPTTESDASTEDFDSRLELLGALAPGTPVALLVADRCEPYFPLLSRRSNVFHLMAQDHPMSTWELRVTTRKILSRNIFGTEKYVAGDTSPWRRMVRSSEELADCRSWIEKLMAGTGVSGRLVGRVVLAADELVSNALYHAPQQSRGGSRHGPLDRSSSVALAAGEEASLELAYDGDVIAVAVADPFGTLTRDGLAAFLHRCVLRTPDTPGGENGGLGLYTVFRTASSLVVNLSPGKRTEIVALFRLAPTMREYRTRAPSFHVFQEVEQ